MEPLLPLELTLPAPGSRDRLGALHRQLRAAILDGRLQPGVRLPSSRALADALGLGRNTVVTAYDLLLAEGYVTGRHGAGTFVANSLPGPPRREQPSSEADPRLAAPWRNRQAAPPASAGSFAWDFRLGLPDGTQFPYALWRRLEGRALRSLSRQPAGYGDPQGLPALRAAIAHHVSATRAVACGMEDVVATAGAQQAFDLLARVLVTPGETLVALEDPGYPPLRAALEAAGARLAPVPVDGEGLVVEQLPDDAAVVCVTPSHQFPLGVPLSAARRRALLDWAAPRRAVVIEDDYDGEFRYAARPLDALQTLDRQRSVFYIGTFSKTLLPALRQGFVVAPPWARAALAAARQAADWQGPPLAEAALAAFIAEGHMARHVRRMQRLYGERRRLLLGALERHCAAWLAPLPALAGLHLAARLTPALPAGRVVEAAARAGLGLEALARYALLPPAPNGLAFGFGSVAAAAIEPGIARLAALLGELCRGPV